jgi:hypothetical protein
MKNRSCYGVGTSGTGEGEGRGISLRYLICLHEKRTMKLIEMIFSRGEGVRKNNGGDESNQGTL